MEPDLLSQWRGYADDGKGFSVGFDRVALEKYKEDSFNLLTVHSGFIDYSESNRKNLLFPKFKILFQPCTSYQKRVLIAILFYIYSKRYFKDCWKKAYQ